MSKRPAQVIGPVGEFLSMADLPPRSPGRWTPRRKGEVVAAVRGGLLTFDEACARYSLSMEELTDWQRASNRSGLAGLRITRLQHYRGLFQKQDRY